MRPIIKWGLIIFAISSIAIGLGVGLGLGLNDDGSSNDDQGDDSVDIGPKPDGDYVVATISGWLQGYRYDQSGKTYNDIPFNNLLPNIPHDTTYFLGIPYAAPPVGKLRWKAPLDPANWIGLRKGDTTGPACAQKCDEPCDEKKSSEDCLYLNIFVPNRAIDTNDKVAVGIWFHGGAFRWGQGGSILYDGRILAGQSDMIIVTVNYRLSAFGFLYTNYIENDQSNTGNWGFLDQQKAIKWVNENIANFNGDPDRITVFGESAGAISSIQHVINSESSKYFRRAIIQSNPLTIPFKESWEAGIQANYFAKEIGCPDMDMECMRSKSIKEVTAATDATPIIINNERILHAAMPFGPVVDQNIILEQPYDSLMEGRFDKSKNIIWGMVQHETEIYVRTVFGSPVNDIIGKATWRLLIQDQDKTDKIIERFPFSCNSSILPDLPSLNLEATDAKHLFKELITKVPNKRECEKLCDTDCDQEAGILCGLLSGVDQCSTLQNTIARQICDPIQNDERRIMEPPATQWIFTCPMRKFLKNHGKDIYVYEFRDFMPIDLTKVGDEGEGWENYDTCEEFSCHGAELSYVFASEEQLNCTAIGEFPQIDKDLFTKCLPNGQITDEKTKRLERYIHRLWSNFARTGNPNDETGMSGTFYSKNYPNEKMKNLPEWKAFSEGDSGWFEISSHDNTDFKFTPKFHTDDCEFWDSLDLYAK